MHRIFFIVILVSLSWAEIININVPAPAFSIQNKQIIIQDVSYINPINAPNLPHKTVTIALPFSAELVSVSFSGNRLQLEQVEIKPALPQLPLSNDEVSLELMSRYQNKQEEYYHNNQIYPREFGTVISQGGLRKYSIVTIALNHFAYQAQSQMLYYTPNISISINFRLPSIESEQYQFWQKLKDDISIDNYAREIIYNWTQAQQWYQTDNPRRSNGYYIIIPSAIQSSVDSLVAYRQQQGYQVNVVTTEFIQSNITGIDMMQKIRNYLRANLANIEYVLLVGLYTDLPWRNMVPFNNLPNSPWGGQDYSPIPSDLYYAELTAPDSLSWDSDQDYYYGEIYNSQLQYQPEDNPDYHADIHLGRIPTSNVTHIQSICRKMIAFDMNMNLSYKTAALLTGAVYYYANEDNNGRSRNDGATYMEQLMNDSVINRSNAVFLYEKGGLSPCPIASTDSLTRTNHIAYWQQKGIMYEAHHGNYDRYARKLWAWDDGDSVPEVNEIYWSNSFSMSDVNFLNNDFPSTTFLRSCLCGKPEVMSLGSELLRNGASSVISSSRICWMSMSDPGGMPYRFYKKLLKDTVSSHGIIGNSYDLGRNEFMAIANLWLAAYHYNLFGDPALRQFGRVTGIQEQNYANPIRFPNLTVYPNPSRGIININLNSAGKIPLILAVYDATGRCIRRFEYNNITTNQITENIKLHTGIYFIKTVTDEASTLKKVIITQ
jgi:hypothetical protein